MKQFIRSLALLSDKLQSLQYRLQQEKANQNLPLTRVPLQIREQKSEKNNE